jgi:SAM-dependent methyltransferase
VKWFERFFGPLYGKVLDRVFAECQTLWQVQTVKRLLKLRKGQRVLDIPCGLGRLTIPLAREGLVMTGLDLAAPYIRCARRRAAQAGLAIHFIKEDMRALDFEEAFDAAFNWFSSIGYFSDAENVSFCTRVLHSLKPGGRFLIETMNKSWFLSHFRKKSEITIAGMRVVIGNRWDARRKHCHSTWVFQTAKRTERYRVSVCVYDGRDLRSLLQKAGFCDIRLFGYPPLGKLTQHAPRLLAVARRPLRTRRPSRASALAR